MRLPYCIAGFISLLVTLHPHLRAQWTMTGGPAGLSTHCLAASGSKLFAGTDYGIYLTTDNGTVWKLVTPPSLSYTTVALQFSGERLYAGIFGRGIYVTTDFGATWEALNAGLTNSSVMDLDVSGDYMYVATRDAGIFRSTDRGAYWSLINNGLPETWIREIVASGPDVFAGTRYHGVVHSTDYGENWAESNAGLAIKSIYVLAMKGSTVFAGGFGGVFSSTNNGASWNDLNTSGLSGAYFYDLAFSGADIFAGTDDGPFLSTDDGASWTPIRTGLPDTTYCYALIVSGGYVFTATYKNNVWKRPLSEVLASADRCAEDRTAVCYLDGSHPNPVRSTTRISFRLAVPSFVRLKVYDMYGRAVEDLACEELSAGSHTRDWSASRMRPGTYLIQLQAGSTIMSTRAIVVR